MRDSFADDFVLGTALGFGAEFFRIVCGIPQIASDGADDDDFVLGAALHQADLLPLSWLYSSQKISTLLRASL
jgi:hypothetical protein